MDFAKSRQGFPLIMASRCTLRSRLDYSLRSGPLPLPSPVTGREIEGSCGASGKPSTGDRGVRGRTDNTQRTHTFTVACPSSAATMSLLVLVLVTLCSLQTVSAVSYSRFQENNAKCERITIPMCVDMRYNMTSMPNLVGHPSQKDAAIQLNEFIPLIQVG